MEEFAFFEYTIDSDLHCWCSVSRPELAMDVIEDPSRITAIRFNFITDPGVIDFDVAQKLIGEGRSPTIAAITAIRDRKYKSKLYFIGRIVSADEVREFLRGDVSDDAQFAVSYDERGEIADIRSINDDGLEEVIPVDSPSDLEKAFEEITGEKIKISSTKQ